MSTTLDARKRVVEEAMSWAVPATPYHHGAHVKGSGVDCAWLLLRVYGDLGIIPPVDPGTYSQQWFLHRDQPLYLEHVQRHARQVEVPQSGDVAMYSFGRQAAHGAIVIDDHSIVHAYMPAGRVILTSRGELARRLHSYWSPFAS